MSYLDAVAPFLGPLGPALTANSNDVIVLAFSLFALVCLGLHFAKKSVFETSKAWVGATVALTFLTIIFRGMGSICGCTWYFDPSTGGATQLVPLTYLLITGSFFAIVYNFNIAPLKKWKWPISIPLSIVIALVSDIFFPLTAARPTWVLLELILLSPLGAAYANIVYEKTVLHMGDYRARLRRFVDTAEGGKGKKAGVDEFEKKGFAYFTFGILGRRITRLLPMFKSLKGVLSLSGMKVGYKAYVSMMAFIALVAAGISLPVWFLLFSLGIGNAIGIGALTSTPFLVIIATVLFSIITGAMVIGVMYMIPFMKEGSRKQRLDQFLPFTASYMTVLASAGVTPERILRSTAEKDPKFMLSDEISNVVGRIDLLGYDVINALNAEVERSPSTNYQDLLRGFAGVVRTGGDMKKFFHGITEHLFQKRALSVQSFLDTLGIIAETYVLMLIAFPLMLIVMLSIMASIGGSLGGIDVFSFMYLLSFILIPICGVVFLFLLDTMQPKG